MQRLAKRPTNNIRNYIPDMKAATTTA